MNRIFDDFDPLEAYSQGFVGAYSDPRADEEFADSIIRHGGDPNGASVAHHWGIADAGKDKLVTLTPVVEDVFPGSFPGPPQLVGDCVGRATANCLLGSIAHEIYDGKPDEVTGKVEGKPELPDAGVKHGVVSSESIYAWRGYNSHGWICSASAKTAMDKGFLIRKPYPDLGIDLTQYNRTTIALGGSPVPGSKWLAESQRHVCRNATILKTREEVRDFLAAGYCVLNCSSLGFESTRNEDGFSKQVGSWAHAQIMCGYDDRASTKAKYGQALVQWQNSWNRWNRGPRTIRGTNLQIPEGGYWALASTIDRCNCIALSSVAGWPRRQHTTYGAEGFV